MSETIKNLFPGQLAEPHITVKAQCGLTLDIDKWFPKVIRAVKGFGGFDIEKASSLPIPVDIETTEIWLLRQENDGEPYSKYKNASFL